MCDTLFSEKAFQLETERGRDYGLQRFNYETYKTPQELLDWKKIKKELE